MTLISRDQMPPRTPYEAELRARIARAEHHASAMRRLSAAQDQVVAAARAVAEYVVEPPQGAHSLAKLREALAAFDVECGQILLDTMPRELREALKAPSVIEEGLKGQTASFFPVLDGGQNQAEALGPRDAVITIVAIQAYTHGTDKWDFDSAANFAEAYEKLRHWNERARREWPDMRFTLKPVPMDHVCECGGPLPAGHSQCLMCEARARFEDES